MSDNVTVVTSNTGVSVATVSPVTSVSTVTENVSVVTTSQNVAVTNPVQAVTVASVGTQGPQGPQGPSQSFFYTHTQATSSASWAINHNLNGYPTAIVFDSAGSQCEGSFSYTSTNQMVITFSSAFSGLAYVI